LVDELLPDAEMTKLLAGADAMLGLCASAIRGFFQERRRPPRRKRAVRKAGGRAKAKRR
jgi:hypothetical protein